MRHLAFCAALAAIIGCGQTPPAAKSKPTTGEHAHKPSAHGGIIVEVGDDNYHAEAVFEKGGSLKIYMYGSDETKVQEIEAQVLAAFAKADGDAEATAFELKPQPQTGDKAGMTSLFVGPLPKELVGKKLTVTIPIVKVGADRFRISFESQSVAHGVMPDKKTDDAERALYLTAGGKYTDADIKANGGVTASVKFKGIKAEHDMKPTSGTKICPITMTKANPKFSWVIGGKTYEFCCPPCVDEFVQLAKDKPEALKDPEEYRKP